MQTIIGFTRKSNGNPPRIFMNQISPYLETLKTD